MKEIEKSAFFIMVSLPAALISGFFIILIFYYLQFSKSKQIINHYLATETRLNILEKNDRIGAEIICIKSLQKCFIYNQYGDIAKAFPYSSISEHKKWHYEIDKGDYLFLFPVFVMKYSYAFFIFLIFVVDLLMFYIIQKIVVHRMQNKFSKEFARDKSLVENRVMITLTENLHHELSSPVLVLKSMYHIIKKDCAKCIGCPDPGGFPNPEINKIVDNSFEQIDSIIDSMKRFKKLRISNGDKTIYDLVEGAATVIQRLIDHNFEIKIDECLKSYRINHASSLTNGDLLNILINMIKNSIEAAATRIDVSIEKISDSHIYILIRDNGSGIPESVKNKIFTNDFSTKNDGMRGNGLYIAKILLSECGGNLELVYSARYENTVFRLKIPQRLSL